MGEFCASSHEVCPLVASELMDRASTTNKPSQGINEGVSFEGVGSFDVHSSRSHAGEEHAITLQFLPSVFDDEGPKIIHSAVCKGQRRLKAIFE